jgi:hypothetical protein
MRLGPDQVGPRGWLLIAATGLVGVGLAVHGYGRGAVLGSGTAGIGAPVATSGGSSPTVPTPSSTAPSSSSSTTVPAKGSSPTSGPPAQKLGPLLSSTQYAQYAYQVYPGPESSRTRQATAGFDIQVTSQAGTIHLSVSVPGNGQAQTASYPAGDRVYFIEATLGDDSGNSDYSFGDDGVVVTNAQGYLVQ